MLPEAEKPVIIVITNIVTATYLLPEGQTRDVLLRQHTDVSAILLQSHRLLGQTLAAPVPVHPVKQASSLQTLTHTAQQHLTAGLLHTHLKLRGLLKGGQF